MSFDGFWYRCEVKHYSVADEWGDHAYSSSEIHWTKYAVIAETPKGVWLSPVPASFKDPDVLRGKRDRYVQDFVRGQGKKQLACPTKEAALADAIERKKRHVAGCQARLRSAQNDLDKLQWEQASLATFTKLTENTDVC